MAQSGYTFEHYGEDNKQCIIVFLETPSKKKGKIGYHTLLLYFYSIFLIPWHLGHFIFLKDLLCQQVNSRESKQLAHDCIFPKQTNQCRPISLSPSYIQDYCSSTFIAQGSLHIHSQVFFKPISWHFIWGPILPILSMKATVKILEDIHGSKLVTKLGCS